MDVSALLPARVGGKIEFSTENGRKWSVKRRADDEYVLAPVGKVDAGLSRWGSKEEISQDLQYLAETGSLLRAKDRKMTDRDLEEMGVRPFCPHCDHNNWVYELRPRAFTCQRHREWFLDRGKRS